MFTEKRRATFACGSAADLVKMDEQNNENISAVHAPESAVENSGNNGGIVTRSRSLSQIANMKSEECEENENVEEKVNEEKKMADKENENDTESEEY